MKNKLARHPSSWIDTHNPIKVESQSVRDEEVEIKC